MTENGLTIRKADDATQGVAGDLLRRYFAEEGLAVPAERQRAGLAALLADPRGAVLLAFRDGAGETPAGIATVRWSASVAHLRVAEIDELYVPPSERHRGVATALVETVASWATGQGCTACRVAVGPDGELRHGVSGFFGAHGFDDEYRKVLARALRPDER
jgi:GNAT superfamily N-acetyltransferase